MTVARVIRLRYVSLNMLDREEVARDVYNRPGLVTARLREALGGHTFAVVYLPPGLNLFSPVVAALIAFKDETAKAGGEVVLATSESRCLTVFALLGLEHAFRRFETVEAALLDRAWIQGGDVAEVSYEILN